MRLITKMGKNNFVALSLKDDLVADAHRACLETFDKINEYTDNKIKFLPMGKSDIHMTVCFLGQILNENRKEKMVICNNNFEYFRKHLNGNVLEFDKFSLFGTHRNLIVAKFKCNNKKFIDKMIEFKRMFCQIGAKKEDYFTPHITIGKINNFVPNDERIKEINEILSKVKNITATIVVDNCILL